MTRTGVTGRCTSGAVRGGRALAFAVAVILTCAGVAPGQNATPSVLVAQGTTYYQAGNLSRAHSAFAQAAAASPRWATPALWLGAVLVAEGSRSAAGGWFKEALKRHPSLPEESCARLWLDMLGVAVSRPRWRLHSRADYVVFVRASNPSATEGQARWLAGALISAAQQARLDPRLLAAVVFIESRFNHQSISSAGAEGLGQLMPGTAAGLGVDPRDPWQNLVGAARLLRLNLDEFGTYPLALAAYNAGGAAVHRWGGIPPYAETQWYVWVVLWVYDGIIA
jgi:soluble lytic murein transglycosylase-like protein